MWTLLKTILLKWAFFRVLLKVFGSLAFFIPIGFLLKVFGLPLLGVLGTLALPVLIMLAIFGLPIILVIVFGGMLLSVLFAVLSIGLAALNIVLPIVLIFWFVQWLTRKNGGGESTAEG
jgi:hypothetical protein